jgi:hypothetical protein
MDFYPSENYRAYEIIRISKNRFRFILISMDEMQQEAEPRSTKSYTLVEYSKCMPILKKKQNLVLPFPLWNEWSRKYWMTISDIVNLPPDTYHDILILDRNVLDTAPTNNKKYRASTFFKESKAVLYRGHNRDPVGSSRIIFDFDGEIMKNQLHITYSYNSSHFKPHWYPLNHGVLPGRDWQSGEQLTANGKPKSWTAFKADTAYLGWRGPMIMWETVVKKLPKIHG